MRTSKTAFSTAAALQRVFIAPIEQSQLQLTRRTASSTGNIRRPNRPPRLLFLHQRRCYALSPPVKSRLPRDHEIKSWSVTLVGEDGKLQEPRSTAAILEAIDLKKESLVVVVPGGPGVPPICKIMNKEAMRAAEKAKAKAGRGVVTTKTIELNWAIDGNDLSHRIAKLKGFLEKGYRVEVVLAPKKKGRKATEEDAERVMGRIKGAVGEVRGAKEFKPMEGKLLGLTTLCFEGKVRKEKRQEQEQEAETEAQGDQSFF